MRRGRHGLSCRARTALGLLHHFADRRGESCIEPFEPVLDICRRRRCNALQADDRSRGGKRGLDFIPVLIFSDQIDAAIGETPDHVGLTQTHRLECSTDLADFGVADRVNL